MSSNSTPHSFAGAWATDIPCRTIPFPDSMSTMYLALSKPHAELAKNGKLCTLHVEDGCLEAVGIFPGDEIMCKDIDSSDEIDPYKVYVVKNMNTDELVAGRVLDVDDEWISMETADGFHVALAGSIQFKESLFVMRPPDGRGHFDRDVSPFRNAKPWDGHISSHLREVAREKKTHSTMEEASQVRAWDGL